MTIRLITASICLSLILSGCARSGDQGYPSPTPVQISMPTNTQMFLPDLTIGEITIQMNADEICHPTASSLKVMVEIENRGYADSGKFIVKVNNFRQEVKEGLVAGEKTILLIPKFEPRLEIQVDATYLVPESNEKNNQMVRELSIPTAPPYCALTPTAAIATMQPFATLKGHSAEVLSVGFSPDGNLLASGSVDNTVRLWRVKEGALLRTMYGHAFPVLEVKFSPNGASLATASTDGLLRLWQVSNGIMARSFEGHAGWVTGMDFSPDGKLLVSCAEDFTVRLWRLSDGRVLQIIDEGMASLTDITFSPSGNSIAWAESDGTLRFRSISGKWLGVMKADSVGATSLAFSPNGSWLVSGYTDGRVRVWQAGDSALVQTAEGHSGAITSLAFSPDGKRLASGSKDSSVRLWRFEEGQLTIQMIFFGHSGAVNSVAFSPKGTLIASASDDNTIRLWMIPEE